MINKEKEKRKGKGKEKEKGEGKGKEGGKGKKGKEGGGDRAVLLTVVGLATAVSPLPVQTQTTPIYPHLTPTEQYIY